MVAVVLVSVAAADFALAQLGKAVVPGWGLRTHRTKFRTAHPLYHHDFAPMVDVVDRWGNAGYALRTNSWGLRDATTRVLPAVGDRPRLAVIGDSFTEGVGYPWEQTFVGRMAAALAPGTEVLNLAVSSYSPAIYYRKVKDLLERGLRFDHLVVAVDLGDVFNEATWYELTEHDIVRQTYNSGGGVNLRAADWLAGWFEENSVLGKLGYTLGDLWRHHRARRHLTDAPRVGGDGGQTEDPWLFALDVGDSAWTFSDARWDDYGRTGVERSLANMDRLKAVLDAHGIGLTVAIYPWPAQILRGENPSRQQEVYGAWCDRNGVPLVDLFPTFINQRPAPDVLRQYFIPHDVHWNAEGHAAVAETLLTALRRNP